MSNPRSLWVYPNAYYYELLVSCESQKIDNELLEKTSDDICKPDFPLEVLFAAHNREKSLTLLWPKFTSNMRNHYNPNLGLYYAIRFGNSNLVKIYLNPRQNQDKIYVLRDLKEVASLHIDAFFGGKEKLEKLKIDILDQNKGPALKDGLLKVDQFGNLPLHTAIAGGDYDMVKFMLTFTRAEAYDLIDLPMYALESRNAKLAPLFMNKLISNAEKHGEKYFEKYGSFSEYVNFLLKAVTRRNKNSESEIVTILNSISDITQKDKWIAVFRDEVLKAGFSDIFIAMANNFVPAEHLIPSLIESLFILAENNPLEKIDTSKLVIQCYMPYIQKNPHYLYEILNELLSELDPDDKNATENSMRHAESLLTYMPDNLIETAKNAGDSELVQKLLSAPKKILVRDDEAITYELFELAKAGKDFMPLREKYKKYFSTPDNLGTPFTLLCAAHLEFFAGDYKQARKYFEDSLCYLDQPKKGVISLATTIRACKILALLENTNCKIAPHFIRTYKNNLFKLIDSESFNFKLPFEALLFITNVERKEEKFKSILDAIDEIEEILPPFKNSDQTESWHLLYGLRQSTSNIDNILNQLYNKYINTSGSKDYSALSVQNSIAINMMKKNLFNFMKEIDLRLKNSNMYKNYINDSGKSYENHLKNHLNNLDKIISEQTEFLAKNDSISQQVKGTQKTQKANKEKQEPRKELKLVAEAKKQKEKEKAAEFVAAKLLAAEAREKEEAEQRTIKAQQKKEKSEAKRLAIAAQKAKEAERKAREEAKARAEAERQAQEIAKAANETAEKAPAEKVQREILEKAAVEAKAKEEAERKAREEAKARAEAERQAQEIAKAAKDAAEKAAAEKAQREALEKITVEAKVKEKAEIEAEVKRQAEELINRETIPQIITSKTDRSAVEDSHPSILTPAVSSARVKQQQKKQKPEEKVELQNDFYVMHPVPMPIFIPAQEVQALHQQLNVQHQQIQYIQLQHQLEIQQWQHQLEVQKMKYNQEIQHLQNLLHTQQMQYAQEMQKMAQIIHDQQKQIAFDQQIQLEQQEEFAYQLQLARKNAQAPRYIEKQSGPILLDPQQSAYTHAVNFGIPPAIARLYKMFEGRIFLVGGANRDYYWNVKPHDHDHVLFATLAEFKSRYPNVTYVIPPTESFISCIIDGYKADFILRPCKSREENINTLLADAQDRDLTMNTAYREFSATGSCLVGPISANAKLHIKKFYFDLANYAFAKRNFMIYPARRYRAMFLEHNVINLGARPTYSQIYIDNINEVKVNSEEFIAACRRNNKAVRNAIEKEISYDKARAYRILLDEQEDNTLLNAGIFLPDEMQSLRDTFIHDFLRCILSLKNTDSNLSKITCLIWHYLDVASRKTVACTSVGTSQVGLFAKRYDKNLLKMEEAVHEIIENTLFEKDGRRR